MVMLWWTAPVGMHECGMFLASTAARPMAAEVHQRWHDGALPHPDDFYLTFFFSE
jgi:hypothetical protein